ncbi:inverse autotransporter beta domain-containing protein [Xenorhabdus sp. PB30.3]|uniref:inverse autotransporter beta domain-containing protein n=1 Tax=Xenorhabdus sp. PB30.3 TaxID=2788941 RepID=UPI001E323681|nr:inverse autotransporter beta domain-containing protein [Xenorhabdus sp. PB30.3]MCC8381745.1 inverse autotransporter beta domain-containing protein [Xenorhabdus sp. PB30.3]
MPSYIGKIIVFFTIVYTLLIPSTIMNAFAEGYINHEKTITSKIDNVDTQVTESSKKFLTPKTDKKDGAGNTSNTSEYEHADAIGRNIQMAGNILSSSSSELAEQAKSYALGKVNSTISSEAQKWLSQSGTAKINFGFDRKGRLENNSVDLLLPIYDNQAAWFFFSQLGYRNKDSRNTVNLGLGGRYFSQNWMYGLNTFYDYDITGKNRRVGLGGELWGDYIKFSTNGYYRLSDWQISRNFEEHHERPANGYDINGEFFLSAYPNLGGKFSYEQYFGDNVTLFNRKTKQKNPSLAKMGVTYTPIPLITVGVDYKQGERGQSETQFLTNFNLRFGVPLSAQLSPDNVASMRTLAGSRYDLVERNNNIVLEHREVPKSELSVPGIIVGYSREIHDITKELSANTAIQQINIEKGNAKEEFIKNGGDIYLNSGEIYIKFPKYLSGENKNNSYALNISAELKNDQKTKPKQMNVIVRPFEIKKGEGANFTPPGPLLASGDQGYTFNPIITSDTPNNPNVIKNAIIHNVEWFAIPVGASASAVAIGTSAASLTLDDNICKNKEITDKLKFKPNSSFKQINIMNDGHIAERDRVTLMSTGFVGAVAVCVAMDSQPRKFMGKVVFDAKTTPLPYHIKEITVTPAKTITADGKQFYTYTAQFVDNENHHLQKKTTISGVKWNIKNPVTGLTLDAPKGDVETDETGKLQAKLTSTVKVDDVMVSLAIEGLAPVDARAVSFKLENIIVTHDCSNELLVFDTCKYTAKVTNSDDNPEKGTVTWKLKKNINGVCLTPAENGTCPNPPAESVKTVIGVDGIATIKLKSEVAASDVIVTASTGGNTEEAPPVEFKWPTIQSVKLDNPNGSVVPGEKPYSITAKVKGADGKTGYSGDKFKFKWSVEPQNDHLSLEPSEDVSEVSGGELKAQLNSNKEKTPPDTVATVCLTAVGAPLLTEDQKKNQCVESIKFKLPPFDIESVIVGTMDKHGKFHKGYDSSNPLVADGNQAYAYQATIKNKETGKPISNYEFSASDVNWERDHEKINTTEFPIPEIVSYKTNNDGQLYAMLKSNVGVDDVSVKLYMTDSNGTKLSKSADEKVDFEAIIKSVGLYVINQYDEKVNKFVPAEISKRPYIYFDSLVFELRKNENKPLADPPKDYNVTFVDEAYQNGTNSNPIIYQDPNNKNRLLMVGYPGESNIIANVTKIENGAKYSYSYTISFRRYLFTLSTRLTQYKINDNHSCETSPIAGHTYRSPTKNQVVGSGIVLAKEFPNAFKWGLFHNFGGIAIEGSAKFKVLKDSASGNSQPSEGDFLVYDAYHNKIVPNYDGLGNPVEIFIICSSFSGAINANY